MKHRLGIIFSHSESQSSVPVPLQNRGIMQAISGVIVTGINSLLWPSGLAERIRDSRSSLLLFMGLVVLITTSIKNFKKPHPEKADGVRSRSMPRTSASIALLSLSLDFRVRELALGYVRRPSDLTFVPELRRDTEVR